PKPLNFAELSPVVGSPEYYDALRTYKKSDHAIAFAWWGNSANTGKSPDVSTRFIGLPDSMDIVSLWGGIPTDPNTWEEMQYVRKVKGTKFTMVMFGSGVERLMRKNFPELSNSNVLEAIDAVAKSIADTVDKYQIDGFDLDYEPGYGDNSIFGNNTAYATNSVNTQR